MSPKRIKGTGLLYWISFWNSYKANEQKVKITIIKLRSEYSAAAIIRNAYNNPEILRIINSFTS